jgi:hypothetical protein
LVAVELAGDGGTLVLIGFEALGNAIEGVLETGNLLTNHILV